MIYKALDANTGELKFYGNISQWWISGEDFTRTLEEMAAKFNTIHIRTHCYGGSVFEGNVIANAITRCKAKVIVYIDGVSASMMGIVMQYADEVEAAENAFVMVHCPSGTQQGTAKQFLSVAKLLTAMEKNFTKKLAQKTGKPESEISAWFDGNDHWFSAEEALEAGLITKVSEPVVTSLAMDKPTANGEVKAVFDRFAALLTEPINEAKTQDNLNMKKELIAKFGLKGVTETSTDAEFTAAMELHVNAVKQEGGKDTLSTAVEAIIAGMEKATNKVYDADIRASLVTVGTTSGLTVLQAMLGLNTPTAAVAPANAAPAAGVVPGAAGVINVVSLLGGNAANAVAADRSNWSWDKWQAEDQAGLEDMEKNNNDAFKALYLKEFGVTL